MQTAADDRVRAAGWLIALQAGGRTQREPLATLAATSADPVVQAYAQRACRGDPTSSSACLALPPDAWARLEPDNAAAWLALAADARADAHVQIDALRQAARASRFETHMPLLHALVAASPRAGADGDSLAIAGVVTAARGDWLATEALRMHCLGVSAHDDDARTVCDAIAVLLQTQAQALPDLQQALEVGIRLGWSAERRDVLRDDIARLAAVERQVAEIDDPQDCAALARTADYYAGVGRVGPIATLRQAIDDGVQR